MLAAAGMCSCARPRPPLVLHGSESLAVPAPDWDAVFARTDGWTGADGVYSVDLGGDRTAILFSDTWVGSVRDGQHAPGSRLVNNSIGVLRTSGLQRGAAPAADAVTFYWGPDGAAGDPTAWIVPDPSRVQTSVKHVTPGGDVGWYWLADAAMIPRGFLRRPCLVMFFWHVGRAGHDDSVWNFKSLGGAIGLIDNSYDPPSRWHVTQYDNPYDLGEDGAKARGVKHVTWGPALYVCPARDAQGGAYVYVYGVRSGEGWDSELVLARAPSASIERFDTWRFYAGPDRWSAEMTDVTPIAHQMVSELSVERVVVGGRPILVMVHSEPMFGDRIFVRIAERPEGPWSAPQPVFRVPGIAGQKLRFTYAAKGHAHLSAPGELLVSYVINSNEFWDMAADASIYHPRFIRVPLDRLIRPAPTPPAATQPS